VHHACTHTCMFNDSKFKGARAQRVPIVERRTIEEKMKK
jgi:hypothetical protein